MSFAISLLQAISFLDFLAVGLIDPSLCSRVRHLGGNNIHLGLLCSVYAGFQLCSGPIIGSLSDLKGRKPILIITLLICSVAYTCLRVTDSISVILFIRAITGTFQQTQNLSRAMVPEYKRDHKSQSKIYGKMAALSGVGISLGPVIGGHITDDFPDYGFRFIALFVGILFAANAGLVNLLPVSNQSLKKACESGCTNVFEEALYSVKQSYKVLLRTEWSKYWDIFLLKGLVGFTMGIYYCNYAAYLNTMFDLTPKHVGYIISFQGVTGSLSSFFIGSLNSFYKNDRDFSQRNLHIFVMMSVSLLGMILSRSVPFYILWSVPLAVGNSLSGLITLEMLLRKSRKRRGTLIGALNSVRSLSEVMLPMLLGCLTELMGVTKIIYVSLLSTLIGVILCFQLKRRTLKID